MPNRARSTPSIPSPWWLLGGDEECRHCGQGYTREVEIRCAECDDACCLLCTARIEGRMLCPECAAETGG